MRQQEQTRADVRLESTPSPGQRPPIPHEAVCQRTERLALEGDSAPVFQWALAHADRTGDAAVGRCLGVEGVREVI